MTDRLSLSSVSELVSVLYSPILEEQILEQWSHGQVLRLLNGCASCLRAAR